MNNMLLHIHHWLNHCITMANKNMSSFANYVVSPLFSVIKGKQLLHCNYFVKSEHLQQGDHLLNIFHSCKHQQELVEQSAFSLYILTKNSVTKRVIYYYYHLLLTDSLPFDYY